MKFEYSYEDAERFSQQLEDLNRLAAAPKKAAMQSYYIAMLSKYLDMQGLVFPIEHQHRGREYVYDFLHLASGRVVKIFTKIDKDEIEGYRQHFKKVDTLFIFDLGTFLPSEPWTVGCIRDITSMSEELLKPALDIGAYIYLDGLLWEPSNEPEVQWRVVESVERKKLLSAIESLMDE